MNKTGVIYGINGPVVYLKGNTGFKMSEMVYVGKERLVGEVIALTKDTTTVQVFEETTGLKPGETVTASGDALSVTLGPGIRRLLPFTRVITRTAWSSRALHTAMIKAGILRNPI